MKTKVLIALLISLNLASSSTPGAEPGHPKPTAGGDLSKCPVMGHSNPPTARHTAAGAMSNRNWWPNQLNLKILHQNSLKGSPMDADFN